MARQSAPCLRCSRIVEINEIALVVDVRVRAVGLEDVGRSSQASVYICVDCTDTMAKGDKPNERTRPLDFVVAGRVQDFVCNDPSFTVQSWLNLRKECGYAASTLSDPRVLKAWNEFKRVAAVPSTIERGREDSKQLREAS